MTTCFVAQFGSVCMAAADTRFSAEGGMGLPPSTWDSADMPLTTATGNNYLLPYRFRKIRQLHLGWAVTAGCFATGDRMLTLLTQEHTKSADHAAQILNQSAAIELTALEEMSDVTSGSDQIYKSLLLGVPATLDRTGVWIASLDRSSRYTVSTAPRIAMNWPLAIPPVEQEAAQNAFAAACTLATDIAGLIRAAGALIGAARTAPDSSPIAQIGVTLQVGLTDFEARYFHGHVDEIAAMTNGEIVARWEILETVKNSPGTS